ncbi:MAG: chemotaxis protein CheX [bacterium]
MENKFEILFDFAKKSFEEVVLEVTEKEIKSGEPFKIESDHRLSIVIGLSGETNGRILLETSVEYGKSIAKAMNFGDELENEEDLYMYLAEFSNMFCGRTATYINDKFGKREVWLAPPAIFSAKDLEVITPHVTSKKAYYNSDLGQFIVDTGFSESSSYDDF